jgi:hypothetical protein
MSVEGFSHTHSVSQGLVAFMTITWAESSFDLGRFLFSQLPLFPGDDRFIVAPSIMRGEVTLDLIIFLKWEKARACPREQTCRLLYGQLPPPELFIHTYLSQIYRVALSLSIS